MDPKLPEAKATAMEESAERGPTRGGGGVQRGSDEKPRKAFVPWFVAREGIWNGRGY